MKKRSCEPRCRRVIRLLSPLLQAEIQVDSGAVGRAHARVRSAKFPSVLAIAPWVFSVIMFVIYALLQPAVLDISSLGLIAITVLILAVVGTGQTIVVLTGGIDLSVGGMMSLGTAILATRMHESSIAFWTLVTLAVGVALGAANGLIITYLNIQPFIVTLATWSIISGAALMVLPAAGGEVPISFTSFLYDSFRGIPVSIILLVALGVVWLWLRRTRVLRRVYAIGSDEEAAFLSGVPTTATKIAAYSLCGFFAMGAAVLYTMETSSGDPTSGDSFILASVAAVVIGGTSLFGGRGGAGGTIAGAIVLTLIADVMLAANVSEFWTPIVQGALMILVVVIGALATRREREREQAL
jgi:ribose transport system permease protein